MEEGRGGGGAQDEWDTDTEEGAEIEQTGLMLYDFDGQLTPHILSSLSPLG